MYYINASPTTPPSIYAVTFHSLGPKITDVSTHIRKLERRFRQIHERILSELEHRGISVSVLLNLLTVIPTGLRQEYKMSIQEVFPDLRREAAIREAFYHLSPLIDFLSCSLLNFIIDEYGSNTLKGMMKSYNDDLIRFMKETTVKQLMDVWSAQQPEHIPPYFSKLRAKLDQDPTTCTLYKLDQLRRRFCVAVRLTDIVLVLIGLESTNSFIAEWIMPSALIPLLMEFSKKLSSEYHDLHEQILEMTVDEIHIFPILPDTKPKAPSLQAAAATSTVIHIFIILIPRMIGEQYMFSRQERTKRGTVFVLHKLKLILNYCTSLLKYFRKALLVRRSKHVKYVRINAIRGQIN